MNNKKKLFLNSNLLIKINKNKANCCNKAKIYYKPSYKFKKKKKRKTFSLSSN